jgi:hypothetical protein
MSSPKRDQSLKDKKKKKLKGVVKIKAPCERLGEIPRPKFVPRDFV